MKGAIVDDVSDPRFLAGHPMAGSELRGLAGARADLFQGCTWVLTPTADTTPETYGTLHGILRELGANVVAVHAEDHDRLVAVASHVPHLLAGALMNEASRVAEQDAILLQLAAGGFRDMTRVAAGDPSIWPDVLFENRVAISQSLHALEDRLASLRVALTTNDRDTISSDLFSAAFGASTAARSSPQLREPRLPARRGERPTRCPRRGDHGRIGDARQHLRHRDCPRYRRHRAAHCCSRSTNARPSRFARRSRERGFQVGRE